MPRSVWKGSVTFGLVNIPVAVYPATREEKVSFKQLRRADLSPIRYKKVAEADEEEVPSAEIVKGYEFEKNQWVIIEDEDLEQVQIESTHAIDITDFVDVAEVHPKYFRKPYWLEAQKGGEKGYALLHQGLVEMRRIGIAKVAIRNREYLAAIKPEGPYLILDLMHFAQEILEPEGLQHPANITVSPKEIAMAKTLIESLSADWQPEKYDDRCQAALRDLIQAKIEKRPQGKGAKAPPPPGGVIDLLAVLEESVRTNADRKKTGAAPRSPSTATLVKRKRRPGPLRSR